jgi:hypothetical protein
VDIILGFHPENESMCGPTTIKCAGERERERKRRISI